MRKLFFIFTLFLFSLYFQASADPYAVVTASNDADRNVLLVYDAAGQIVQTVPTGGQGGVPPHIIGGGIAKSDKLLAVINYNSQSVSVFKQQQGSFQLLQVIPAISKPVSVAFGNNHLYILGVTSIESHAIKGDAVTEKPDGSSKLLVGDGSAAQVGYLTNQLIISERSNMIELVDLNKGVVTSKNTPVQLPPPPKNKTPVGLVTRGSTAYVTIAHSDEVGLVKNGKLVTVISSENQHAPCWLTLTGPWLFSSNTPSKTISRYSITENALTISNLIAAQTKGEPTDIDAEKGIVAVLELSDKGTSLSQFQIDNDGNMKLTNSAITANNANGVAVIDLSNNR